MEDVLLILIS